MDINGDGPKEIILDGDDCGPAIMDMCLPWRLQTLTYSWDGSKYVVTRIEYTQPEYRYQTVQDADREFLYRIIQKRWNIYWSVIEDPSLDWWSAAREQFEGDRWEARDKTPQPVIPTPVTDDQEYDQLSAYAYFRIGLLYLVTGKEEEAYKTFNSLHDRYPFGNPGYPYAMLTGYFMDAYEETRDVVSACQAAIQYAAQNLSILSALDGTNVFQDQIYRPEDICPVYAVH